MTINGWLQIFFYLALILLVTKPLGVFLARVFNGRRRSWIQSCVRSSG